MKCAEAPVSAMAVNDLDALPELIVSNIGRTECGNAAVAAASGET